LIEFQKSYYYAWQWKRSNSQDKLVDINNKIQPNRNKIKQILSSEIIRALEVYMNPYLDWTIQFQKMVEKLTISVTKLMKTNKNIM